MGNSDSDFMLYEPFIKHNNVITYLNYIILYYIKIFGRNMTTFELLFAPIIVIVCQPNHDP